MQFHEKLFELRKNANMTQNDLAEKLDVSRQAVSRWEMGTAMPDIENLIAMSDLFSVSLDYLLKDQVPAPHAYQTEPTQQAEQQGTWFALLLLPPLLGLSLFVYGWLYEKDILCNIGFFLLGLSGAALVVGLVALAVWALLKRLKKE